MYLPSDGYVFDPSAALKHLHRCSAPCILCRRTRRPQPPSCNWSAAAWNPRRPPVPNPRPPIRRSSCPPRTKRLGRPLAPHPTMVGPSEILWPAPRTGTWNCRPRAATRPWPRALFARTWPGRRSWPDSPARRTASAPTRRTTVDAVLRTVPVVGPSSSPRPLARQQLNQKQNNDVENTYK